MKRALLGLAVATFTVLAFAGPASAATGRVTHFTFSGPSAEASWTTTAGTTSTETLIGVSKSPHNSSLGIDVFTSHEDANGNFTGGTDTSATVTSGYSFAIRQPLSSASVRASGMPVTTCTLDANFNVTGCSDTTVNVNVTWTGQGPVTRGTQTQHLKADGFLLNVNSTGSFRDATATGTIAGRTLSTSELDFADLSTLRAAVITVCIGNNC